MKEVTQDETVNQPYDGIHVVVILLLASIGWWLHISEWIVTLLLGIYFAIVFLFIEKKSWFKLFKFAVILLIVWVIQRWLFI